MVILPGKVEATKQQELTELYGTPVTNSLGISDYYLDLINKYIPESNVKARKAALKMFYYDSLAMQSIRQDQILKNVEIKSAGFTCVFLLIFNCYLLIFSQQF